MQYMPRPQKEGIDYFPLDVNFFIDKKIRILKARYGADGITIYLYLLCEIYRAGYYIKFDDDMLYVISNDLKMSPDKVKQVLKFLLERSLLDSTLFQSDTILTSAGIQKRFQLAVKERARKKPIEVKDFWLLEPQETEPFIKVNPKADKSRKNDNKSGKNPGKSQELSLKESKVKESKVKEMNSSELQRSPRQETAYELQLVDGTLYPVKRGEIEKYRELYPAVDVDQEFRKMIGWLGANPKNRKTQRGIGRFINGWLCRAQDSARPERSGQMSPQKNQFHNFPPRNTDYNTLVQQELQERLNGGKDEKSTQKDS